MRTVKGSKVRIRSFSLQKLGNEPHEYEDSFYFNLESGKFAIADGVSESCFAKLWADILTKSFVESDISLFSFEEFSDEKINEVLQSFLAYVQKEWNEKIDWKNLPWYVEEKAKKGAFATFLGLELKRDSDYEASQYHWRAVAIGDCCLFQTNGKQLINSFPVSESTQFGNTPLMLSSRISLDNFGKFKIRASKGVVKTNEKIILATDAVAKWILIQVEANQWTWEKQILSKEEELRSFFNESIKNEKLRNDDITVVVLLF